MVIPELKLTQAELAKALGVSRRTISEIIHEHRPVTPDMAMRLGRFCGNGPRLWLNMQQALDLWELENTKRSEYNKIRKCA